MRGRAPGGSIDRHSDREPITTASGPRLRPDERALFAEILSAWGGSPDLVEETLRDAVFGPGVVGVEAQASKPNHDLAILVDDERDPELARLFNFRRDLDDEVFVAQWRVDVPGQILTLASPSAPEALCAYTVEIARPVNLRRTFMLMVSKQARLLSWLQEPGTAVWLTPKAADLRAWAQEGLGTPDDFYATSLPLAVVQQPSMGVGLALRHVGFTAN